ncbi:hypothetical protein OROMI_001917 [Orobanche minor]
MNVPSNVVHKKRVARNLFIKIRPSQEILKIRDGTSLETEEILTYIKKPSKQIDVPINVVQKKRVLQILFFKIRPSQEILKIRDDTPLETEEILTYIKSPQNRSVWHFSSNLDVPINVVQKKRVARILFFKIRPSQEILKIRHGTPLETEEILTYIKSPQNRSPSQEILKIRDDVPINVVQKKRVARILFFKIRPSQEILKIRHGTPLETEEILTYVKSPQKRSFWHFYSNLDVPSNVVHKKRVAWNLFIKIRPSQKILKIRDGTSLEMEEILTYIKKPSKQIVARILFFKIRPSQEILKIRHGTPLETEEILTYIKSPQNRSFWHFYSNLDVPSNVVQKKRVARILFFKIRPSQEILKIRDVARILFFKIRPYQEIIKIRDGTLMEANFFLIYTKSPQNKSVWQFYSNLDVPSNVVHKKRVARNLFIKIRPSQEILKIRDGTSLETEEILTYIKKPSKQIGLKKRVLQILFFKIRPSQEILKIRDDTPLETEEILTYIKSPQNRSVWHFSSNLDVPSNVVQKKRVARILFFKIRPSQEILKIRDVHKKRVARNLFIKIRPSQEILKIRDGTSLETEEILTYIKKPSKQIDVPINVVQKKRVLQILFFKIRPSQEILKIRDDTPLETEEILTYIKSPQNRSVWHFSSNLDVPINVVQKKRVARILFFKIKPSQEILKIRHGTPLETEEILTYIKSPQNRSFWHFYSNLDVPSNVVQKKRVARILFFKIRPSQEILKIRYVQKKRVARILFFKIRPSQEILKIRDVQKKRVARILFFKIRPSQEILKIRHGTPLETEEILTYIKSPQNRSFWHFYSNLDVPSNVVQKKKRVARILFFKIRPSQEILKIRDDVPSNVVHKKRVARNLFIKIRPSQEILKIRDGTSLETEEILTYMKKPSKQIDVPINVVQKKRVLQILFFKIRPSQEILKIRDDTPLETEEILTYIKSPQNRSVWHFSSNLDVPSNVVQKKRVARILFFKIRPSQEILKIRDDVPSNVVHKKRVARNLFIKIRPSQEILKIRDGTSLETEEILTYIKKPSKQIVARILFFKIRLSQEILKIRHGTPLETEEILTYVKSPQNRSFWHFYSNLDVPSNVVHKKRVARNLFIKIRPSQKILKIRDGTSLEMEEILTYIKKPSKQIEILKIRHGTPLETEEILTYIKSPQNRSFWHFYSNLDVPSNVVQKKRVARILFFKIRPSQEILKIRDEIIKIRDGTLMEANFFLIYTKSPQNKSVWQFYSNLDVHSNVVHKKRVARNLFIKIRPSQEILKIRDGTSLETEEILTYIKRPSKQIGLKKRVLQILFFKIRPSQEILKIRDDTPLETEEILTYIKSPQNRSVWHFSSNLDVPSNVVQKKRVARILFFKIRPSQEILKIRDVHKKRVARNLFIKIRPSQEILKIRDGTSLETEEILTYIKKPSKQIDVPINVVQKKRVLQILFFKIRPSQEILKIRDDTPLETEEILTYIKNPQNRSVWHFSSNLDVPINVVQKKRVARILFFKIRPSQEILKIRHGTPLETEEILTYIKSPQNRSFWHFYSNLDVPSNVVQKKRVARILFFKIRPSQEILKIRYEPSQEILKIRDVQKKRVARILFFKIRPSQEILKIRHGTPLETEEILTYVKSPQNRSFWHFYSNLDVPSNVVHKKRVARNLFIKIRPSQKILKIRDGTSLEMEEILTYIKKPPQNRSVWHFSSNLDVPINVVQKKRVARILFFKIRPSQEILKIRHGTPLETEEILTYIKSPQNRSFWHFYSNLDVPSNVVQKKKRVARILFFKIRPSQEILKIRDDVPSNVVHKKRVARNLFIKIRPSQEILKIRDVQKKRVLQILFFKIRPSQEILKIRDDTPLETEEILTYIKNPQNRSVWHFSSNLDVPINVVQKKRVAQILFFKIRPSQEILKIRHGTPLETEEILTYIKSPQNRSFWHFYSNLDVPSNVVQKKRVARILFFKIRPSQEILKIRYEILKIRDVQKKRVARILFFKIRPSQEILKIRHGTPLETEEILTYVKSPQNRSFWHFYSNLDVPSNVVHKKRVARNLFIKIRPSQKILKIRDGTSLEMEEILTYIKKPPQNRSVWHFSSNLDVPINVVQKKRVARILFFKIRPSQEILKIRHGTPLETEEILTYIKSPQNRSFWHFYSNLDVPSNVVQKKKRVARILFFKIRPSQEILKIRDVHKKRVARNLFIKIRPSQEILKIRDVQKKRVLQILFFKIRPSQEILKIRDDTPLETEEILTYIKNPQNRSVWHFSSNLDVPINVVQKKRVARILFFKIRPSQEILKIRHGTPLETEEILTYIKSPQNRSFWHFYSNLDVPSNVVQKKRVARILFFKIRPSQEILKIRYVQKKRVAWILFFKIRPSQEILKIRHGTPLETEEILTYVKSPQNRSFWHFYSNLDVPSNVVHKKRVARNLFIKIRPSQKILKIRDGTSLEMEEILTYIKKPPQNRSVWHFSSNLDVPINVVQKKRVARILFFKIRPSQEILKIRHGTPLETEEILTYIKSPQNRSFWHFYSNLDVPSNVVQKKKRVARILFFKIRPSQEILKIRDVHKKRVARNLFIKIRPSQEILKIRDGTSLETEEILTYIKKPSKQIDVPINVVQKKRVLQILFFKIRPSQEILKIRDDTPLETEEILTYIKSPQNRSVWHFSSNLDVPSNVVQKKRVARILFFKIRPSQEILKIRDDVPSNVVHKKRVARNLFIKIRPSQEILKIRDDRPSQEILKIRDGTPMEAEEILIYIKSPQNRSVWHFSSNLDVPSNVVQKKRVARILFFKIRPSQEILKIRHGTPLETEEILTYVKALKTDRFVARNLFIKIRPSQKILKIRDGTSLEMEEILTYIKKPPQNRSVWHFSSNLDVPINVVQKKRVARILFFKIRPSQEILKIRHGTPLETEEILTYIKSPQNRSFWHFYSNLDVPSNVVQKKKRVARILFFKIRPSQEILKIRDEPSQEILKIRDVQKKRVARILFFKIRPSQEILKIRHGTPLETEEILTYVKSPQNRSFWHFYSNLDVPSNVVHKKRVARNLFIKIRPSQKILKIRDGTSLEMEEILTYIKKPPQNRSVWHFSSNLDVPINVVQKKRVARILFFKIRPSQEILKIRHGTPLETEEILTYIKSPQNRSFWHFYSNLDVPSNVVQKKKRVARILFFKIRPSQEILKIRDGTSLETEEILT